MQFHFKEDTRSPCSGQIVDAEWWNNRCWLWQSHETDKYTSETKYTGCPKRNVPDFGRVFLMLKYTEITQNTYVQSWTVYGDNGQRKVWSSGGSTHCTCQLTALSMLRRWVWCHMTAIQLTLAINCICSSFRVMTYQPCYVMAGHSCVMYSAWNPKDNYDMSASVFVVQFNGFMSLTS